MRMPTRGFFRRGFLAGLCALWLNSVGEAAAFRQIADGLATRHDVIPEGPLSLQVVRVDRTRTELQLLPTLGFGRQIGLNPLSSQLRLLPKELGQPVAAINGDFYTTENEPFPGDPRGLFISGGELVSAPVKRDCFWLDPQGQPHTGEVQSLFSLTWPDGGTTPLGLNESPDNLPAVLYSAAAGLPSVPNDALLLEYAGQGPWLPLHIGETYSARPVAWRRALDTNTLAVVLPTELRGRVRQLKPDSILKISTGTTPNLRGTVTALGGGPALVHGGRATAARAVKSNERHPRSALGWNAQAYFLVVVDGRQSDWSIGVTLPTLAEYMVGLGCEEAVNLDGGGSTELWLNGRVLNRPCQGRERPTATGLAIVRRETPATNTPVLKSPVPAKP